MEHAPFLWRDETPNPLAPGAVVLSAFPSAGLATTVAAHYVVRALNLPRVGLFESAESAPVAVIQGGTVHPPVRVHGRANLAVVLSEFPPSPAAADAIAKGILDGAEARKARLVIALEGVIPHPFSEEAEPPTPTSADEEQWSITARPDRELRDALAKAGARPLEDGVFGGVTGALLVRGISRRVPVGVLVASARNLELYPDHRAGAALIETLDRLLPELAIDTGPLREQAESIERMLRAAMAVQSRQQAPKRPTPVEPTIYQ